MFVELDERELMKHDGGGMFLSAWDLCHAIEKFIGKNFRWMIVSNDLWKNWAKEKGSDEPWKL